MFDIVYRDGVWIVYILDVFERVATFDRCYTTKRGALEAIKRFQYLERDAEIVELGRHFFIDIPDWVTGIKPYLTKARAQAALRRLYNGC